MYDYAFWRVVIVPLSTLSVPWIVRPKFMLSLSPHTSVRQSKGTYIEAQGPDLFALHFWSQPHRLSGGKSIITFQFFLAWRIQEWSEILCFQKLPLAFISAHEQDR